jgi:hypothetical protein
MRRYIFPPLIALLAELATSWWKWVRAPTDGLRVYYRGNFWSYAAERLAPWLLVFLVLYGIWILVEKLLLKRAS